MKSSPWHYVAGGALGLAGAGFFFWPSQRQLADMQFYAGRDLQALRLYEKHLVSHPQDIQALHHMVELYKRLGDSHRQTLLLQRLIDLEPGAQEHHAALIEIYDGMLDHKRATQIRIELFKLLLAKGHQAAALKVAYELNEAALYDQDYPRLFQSYRDILALDPANTETAARYLIDLALAGDGEPSQDGLPDRLCAVILKGALKDPELWRQLLLARECLDGGLPSALLMELHAKARAMTGSWVLPFEAAEIATNLKRFDEAAAILRAHLDSPEAPAFAVTIDRTLRQLPREQADELYLQFMRLQPNSQEFPLLYAWYLQQTDRQAAAASVFAEIYRRQPRPDLAAAWLGCLEHDPDPRALIAAASSCLELFPNDPRLLLQICSTLQGRAKPAQLLPWCHTLWQLQPDAVSARLLLQTSSAAGEFDILRREFKAWIKLAADDQGFLKDLGYVAQEAGEPALALAAFSQALLLQPDDPALLLAAASAANAANTQPDALHLARRLATCPAGGPLHRREAASLLEALNLHAEALPLRTGLAQAESSPFLRQDLLAWMNNLRSSRPQEVPAALETALRRLPGDQELLLYSASLASADGRHDEAWRTLSSLYAQGLRSAELLSARLQTALASGRSALLPELLRELLTQEDLPPHALAAAALAAAEIPDRPLAERLLTRLDSEAREQTDMLGLRLRFALADGRWEDAAALLERINPKDAQARNYSSWIWIDQAKTALASSSGATQTALKQRLLPLTLTLARTAAQEAAAALPELLLELGAREEALRLLASLSPSPERAQAQIHLLLLLKPAEAAAAAEAAVSRWPDCLALRHLLLDAYAQTPSLAEKTAIRAARAACVHFAGDARLQARLAYLLLAAGHEDQALQPLASAISLAAQAEAVNAPSAQELLFWRRDLAAAAFRQDQLLTAQTTLQGLCASPAEASLSDLSLLAAVQARLSSPEEAEACYLALPASPWERASTTELLDALNLLRDQRLWRCALRNAEVLLQGPSQSGRAAAALVAVDLYTHLGQTDAVPPLLTLLQSLVLTPDQNLQTAYVAAELKLDAQRQAFASRCLAALDADPDSELHQPLTRPRALVLLERHREAADLYLAQPLPSLKLRLEACYCLQACGDHAAIIRQLEPLPQRGTEEDFLLAAALAATEDHARAALLLEGILARLPEDAGSALLLADCYRALGRREALARHLLTVQSLLRTSDPVAATRASLARDATRRDWADRLAFTHLHATSGDDRRDDSALQLFLNDEDSQYWSLAIHRLSLRGPGEPGQPDVHEDAAFQAQLTWIQPLDKAWSLSLAGGVHDMGGGPRPQASLGLQWRPDDYWQSDFLAEFGRPVSDPIAISPLQAFEHRLSLRHSWQPHERWDLNSELDLFQIRCGAEGSALVQGGWRSRHEAAFSLFLPPRLLQIVSSFETVDAPMESAYSDRFFLQEKRRTINLGLRGEWTFNEDRSTLFASASIGGDSSRNISFNGNDLRTWQIGLRHKFSDSCEAQLSWLESSETSNGQAGSYREALLSVNWYF